MFKIGDIVCLKDNDKFIGVIVDIPNHSESAYRIEWLSNYKKVRVWFHDYLLQKVSEV
jgi:hypothetical protein